MAEKTNPAVAAENASRQVEELVRNQPPRLLTMVPRLRDPTASLRGTLSSAETAAHDLAQHAEGLGDAANIRTPYYDKNFNSAVRQFSASKDERVRSFADAAQSSMKAGNQGEAEIALSFAEMLTRLDGLGKAYRAQGWAKAFVQSADSFREIAGLSQERKAEALTLLHDADSSIANAKRSEAMESLSKSNNQFVKQKLDDIRRMYAEGPTKEADMALAYLSYFNSTYNRKDAVTDGASATRAAVEMAIRGDPGAEGKFQEAAASYAMGRMCAKLGKSISDSRDELLALDKEGKHGALRDLLNDAERAVGKRDADGAARKLDGFASRMNSLKAQMALGLAEDKLIETRTLLAQLRKQLALVPKGTPHTGPVSERLESIDKEASDLRDMVLDLRKGVGNTAEFEAKLRDFSKKWDDFSTFYSVSKTVMDELAKTRMFESFLRGSESSSHSLNKAAAISHLHEAADHLQESLRLLVFANDVQAAKREFRQAVEQKVGALPFLYLSELSSHEKISLGVSNKDDSAKRFAFYSEALNLMFDSSVRKLDENTRAKMAETLFKLDNILAISEDSVYARGAGELQRRAIADAQSLIENRSGILRGTVRALPRDRESALESSLATGAGQLNKTVERGRKIGQVVEFGAAFVHPSVLLTLTIKNIMQEYRTAGSMSWSSGLMMAASMLALRHAAPLKGALTALESRAVGTAMSGVETSSSLLSAIEFGAGITLTGLGMKNIYDQLASGKSLRDISFDAALLFVPLAYGTVRPVAVNKARAFAGKRFEALMAHDWSEQAATSAGMERIRLEFSRDGRLVETQPGSAAEIAARGPKPGSSGEAFAKTEVAPGKTSRSEAKTAESASPTMSESSWSSRAVRTTDLESTVIDESRQASARPTRLTEPVNAAQLKEGTILLETIRRDRVGFFSDFSRLEADKREALVSTLRAVAPETATQLSEFAALRNLAKEYGMIPEQLERAYAGAPSLLDARAWLLGYIESTGRIDFGLEVRQKPTGAASRAKALAKDYPELLSLLFSEDMIGNLRRSYPEQVPEGAIITGMKYRGGLRGTIEVEVRMPDDSTTSFFAKRGDSRSARLGARSSLEAGHPAPQVSALRVAKDHATGKPGVYWFMPSIEDFAGTLRIAGRSIDVQGTAEALNMKKVVTAEGSGPNRLLTSRPDIYYRELGRAQAGWMQSGIYDGHELNTYAMFVRVSKEDGAFLKKNGYHVEPDGKRSKLFIFGRIDTDWSGSFGAVNDESGLNFRHMFFRLGTHDLARIFTRDVTERIPESGLTPETLSMEAKKVLDAATPPFIQGVKEWYRLNGGNPSYVAGMRKLFIDSRGNAIGFDKHLSEQEVHELRRSGQLLDPRMPFNGKAARPIDFEDGRSRFVPEDAIGAFNALRRFFTDGSNIDDMWGTILDTAKNAIDNLAADVLEPAAGATRPLPEQPAAAKSARPP